MATLTEIIALYQRRDLQDTFDCCGCSKPWLLYDRLIRELKHYNDEIVERIKGAHGIHARNYAVEAEAKRLRVALVEARQRIVNCVDPVAVGPVVKRQMLDDIDRALGNRSPDWDEIVTEKRRGW